MDANPSRMGLGVEDGGVAPDAFLQGADDGHGPDAVDERGGDQPVGELGVLGLDEFFEPVADAFEQGVHAQQLPGDAAEQDREDDDEDVFDLEGHLEADEQDAESESLEHDGADAFGKAGLQPAAHEAAADNGQCIDDRSEGYHARFLGISIRGSVLSPSVTGDKNIDSSGPPAL